MIEMNPYAIMRMTIDTLKPSSPDLGTCFISTLGESEIDTLTLTINMKNHQLPRQARGAGKGFCQCCEGQSRTSVQILMFPSMILFRYFISVFLIWLATEGFVWGVQPGAGVPSPCPLPDAVRVCTRTKPGKVCFQTWDHRGNARGPWLWLPHY